MLALPAASAPPTRVTAIRPRPGSPRRARNIVGSVVTSSNSMMRGLVSRNSARATTRTERRPRGGARRRLGRRAGTAAPIACVTRSPP